VSFGAGIGEPLDDDLLTFLTHHVVVPAAVIAMVASLLSYLVDVRSAFLGGGPQLKWIGFCFAVATVLTERYGHTQGDRDLQGCYTLALAGATVSVLLMEPWETRAVGLGEKSANLLIIAAVWWLATRVTRGLSPEEGRPAAGQGLRLYSLERLRMQAWQRRKAEQTGAPPPAEKPAAKAKPIPANPAMSVARLAAAALVAFALGEPVLLGAAPQTGIRALAAVVVFLFATGIVLAAGSALDALRRAEWAGGDVSPGLVPAAWPWPARSSPWCWPPPWPCPASISRAQGGSGRRWPTAREQRETAAIRREIRGKARGATPPTRRAGEARTRILNREGTLGIARLSSPDPPPISSGC
jgi:hypothetical protein